MIYLTISRTILYGWVIYSSITQHITDLALLLILILPTEWRIQTVIEIYYNKIFLNYYFLTQFMFQI